MNGTLLVISGPSAGVGKDTILKMFLKKHTEWRQPPSTTTRNPRPGEIHGEDMNFVSLDEFKRLRDHNQFLETDFHINNWYGTLRQPIEELLANGVNVVLRKDVNGSIEIKNKIPDAIIIFIAPDSTTALEERIRARNSEDETAIVKRLELAKKEMTFKSKFDHVVINPKDHPEIALAEIENIINK